MIKLNKTFYSLNIIGFLLALSTALPAYIQSSFLNNFMTLQVVSLYLTGIMALTLIALFVYPHIINRLTNIRSLLIVSIVTVIGLFFLSVAQQSLSILIIFAIQYIGLNLLLINTDIAIENISDDEHTGRIRSRQLTFINIGWLISPLLMGFIVSLGNYQLVYFVASIIMFINVVLIFSQKKFISTHKHYHIHKFKKLLSILDKNINLKKIYSSSFTLRLFYCLMVLYTPIYLHEYLHFEWSVLSIIFTIMLLPFVLFSIPVGLIADKWLGEKEILITGTFLMFITTALMFWLNSTNIFIWTILLFIGRTGAAIAEAMQESYFFKHVDGNDLDLINLFRNLRPFAWLIGTGLSAIILNFLPIQFIFLFLAIVLFFSLYPALTIKDTK